MFGKCQVCGGEFKNLGAHLRSHSSGKTVGELLSSAPTGPSTAAKTAEKTTVRFISTRSPSMRMVIKPTAWEFAATPTGSRPIQVPGKSVQFKNGILETDDPEVIEFLEHKYNDSRFPVISSRTAQEAMKGT